MNVLLSNYKRIADHCSNISVGMISVRLGSFDTHEYQDHLRGFKTGDFESAYARYASLCLNGKEGEFPMKTILIGDIHGSFTQFDALLQKMELSISQDKLILLGDLIDRGPDS